MKSIILTLPALALTAGAGLHAQGFDAVVADVAAQREASAAALTELRQEIEEASVPLTRRLNELEAELVRVRAEFNDAKRALDTSNLDLNNLSLELKGREAEVAYLDGLLGDFISEFDAALHVVERQRYGPTLEAALLAPDNSNLSRSESFELQAGVVGLALDRLEEILGGTRFPGDAVGPDGLVRKGEYALVGPAALFLADGAELASSAEQRVNSEEPTEVAFGSPEDGLAAAALIQRGAGVLPFDPTLGNAHKMEELDETFLEHVRKGGAVMVPIGLLAGAALLVALYKWLVLTFLPRPARRKVEGLLAAVAANDGPRARATAAELRGPLGRMLTAGVDHMDEPRELVEEVMYEEVLTTRLKLQSLLPFIAICAASAPLLGLLGTVTGIISTFKMITMFGSGDVKSLSGGISEALITTKFGLIVAIPSLLLHAFLARKAKGVVDHMEKTAMAFVNRLAAPARGGAAGVVLAASAPPDAPAPSAELVREQVKELLGEMLGPLAAEYPDDRAPQPDARQPVRAS